MAVRSQHNKIAHLSEHNAQTKKLLEEMQAISYSQRIRLQTVQRIRTKLKSATFGRLLCHVQDEVERDNKSLVDKKDKFEKRLHYKNTLASQLNQNEQALMENLKSYQNIVAERLLFKQNIVELAQHMRRYYGIVDKIQNCNKKTEQPAASSNVKPQSSTLAKRLLESSRKPMNDQVMPHTSTSKHQTEVTSNRRNAVVYNELPTTSNVSTAESVENDLVKSKASKRPMSTTESSPKAAVEGATSSHNSPKIKKRKVAVRYLDVEHLQGTSNDVFDVIKVSTLTAIGTLSTSGQLPDDAQICQRFKDLISSPNVPPENNMETCSELSYASDGESSNNSNANPTNNGR